MESVTLRDVDGLKNDERRSLETLLKQPLEQGQQVFIMTFRPGVVPDDATRRVAHAALLNELRAFQQGAVDQGVTLQEVDAAVDEAMSSVRPQSS
jgi:hypothetical protein